MKSMEEYIDEVYKKYEEAEKNHIVYKKVKMKRSNPLPVLCGIAACLVVVLMFYSNLNDVKPDPDNEQQYVSSEEQEDGKIIYTIDLKFGEHDEENLLQDLILNSENIMLVSNFSTISVDYSFERNRLVLETNGKVIVNEILKGDRDIENIKIEYTKYGGLISLGELEKDKKYDWSEWEKEYLGEVIPEEKKSNVYIKQKVPNACEFEEGKQYLVFMKYNEEKECYEFTNLLYGIMEYDPVTNMVKNIDTGEFEEFDWNLITAE